MTLSVLDNILQIYSSSFSTFLGLAKVKHVKENGSILLKYLREHAARDLNFCCTLFLVSILGSRVKVQSILSHMNHQRGSWEWKWVRRDLLKTAHLRF